MPTNLPPQAEKAEQRYREAITTEEKIAALEEFLSLIPKHKGTDHLRGDLKHKLASLRASTQDKKGAAKFDSPYHISSEGAGQAVLVGVTGVGKSAILRSFTKAEPEVSETPFTTWIPLPGMMPFENVKIQLVDTPSLDRGYIEPEFADLLRRADLVVLVVDLLGDPAAMVEDAVKILAEYKLYPTGHAPEELPAGGKEIPTLVVLNKYDSLDQNENLEICRMLLGGDWDSVPVSALTGLNGEEFKRMIYQRLGVIRVYAKPPGRDPDREAPFVLPVGSNVEDFALRVHKDFMENLKYARVWGSTAHGGLMVSRDFILHEGDIVELHI